MQKLSEAQQSLLLGMPLFAGITREELAPLLACLHGRVKQYEKGQYVFLQGAPAGPVGVVLAGAVQVQREDYLGRREILAQLGPGDLFAETFACARVPAMPVAVQATAPARVLLIEYARVLAPQDACGFGARLVANMMAVLAQKNLGLSGKLEHLSRRSTREKLLSYLGQQATLAGGGHFAIPFNRQELADYLCVDRSALSAELSRLKAEGALDYKRSEFWLPPAAKGEET